MVRCWFGGGESGGESESETDSGEERLLVQKERDVFESGLCFERMAAESFLEREDAMEVLSKLLQSALDL